MPKLNETQLRASDLIRRMSSAGEKSPADAQELLSTILSNLISIAAAGTVGGDNVAEFLDDVVDDLIKGRPGYPRAREGLAEEFML